MQLVLHSLFFTTTDERTTMDSKERRWIATGFQTFGVDCTMHKTDARAALVGTGSAPAAGFVTMAELEVSA